MILLALCLLRGLPISMGWQAMGSILFNHKIDLVSYVELTEILFMINIGLLE